MRRKNHYKAVITVFSGVFISVFAGSALAMPTYQASVNPSQYFDGYKQTSYYDLQEGGKLADHGAFDQATPYFQDAVEKNPTSVMAQYSLGYSLMETASVSASPRDQAEMRKQAEWAFLRVRDLNPDLSLTYYKLGKLALFRKDYKAACSYYQSGVQSDPDNFTLWFNLGAADEKIHDLQGAENAYLKAVHLNPKFVFATNNLGLLYEETNRPDLAEAAYRDALNEVPDYNYARLNLGSLLQSEGRLDEAISQYQQAIQYEPTNAWAYIYLGNAYYRQDNYEKSLDAYKKAISLKPDYPTTYYLESLVLEKLNRPDEALAEGLHYINLAPHGLFSKEAGVLVMTLQQSKKRSASAEDKP